MFVKPSFFLVLSILFFSTIAWGNTSIEANSQQQNIQPNKNLKVCAYVASYAPGYEWQDQLEKSLKQTLHNHCTIKTHHMDSKKLSSLAQLQAAGLKAKAFIEEINPSLVIVSDDNAVKFVLQEHYRNSPIPFVFCGVNNSGGNYGLPFNNTTGMIETSPLGNLFKILFKNYPGKSHIAYLTTTGTTAAKNIAEFHDIIRELQLPQSSAYRAQSDTDWKRIFIQLQNDPSVDFIILGNIAALPNWNRKENIEWVKKHTRKATAATQKWMMDYSAIGYTKIPEEQGEWAGLSAIEILEGVPIQHLAVVPNQTFTLWKNEYLVKQLELPLSEELLRQARSFKSPSSTTKANKGLH